MHSCTLIGWPEPLNPIITYETVKQKVPFTGVHHTFRAVSTAVPSSQLSSTPAACICWRCCCCRLTGGAGLAAEATAVREVDETERWTGGGIDGKLAPDEDTVGAKDDAVAAGALG